MIGLKNFKTKGGKKKIRQEGKKFITLGGSYFVEIIFVGGCQYPITCHALLYLIEIMKKNLFKKFLIGDGKILSPLFQ